jgi:hypothetical protein
LDIQTWLLRQRILAEQQHNEVANNIALQSQMARLSDNSSLFSGSGRRDFLRGGGGSDYFGSGSASDLFAARAGVSARDLFTGGSGDIVANHLRQSLLQHERQQVARFQAAEDPLSSYLRASEAAVSEETYASMLASRGTTPNSFFLDQALQQQQRQEAASSLADQLALSAGGRRGSLGAVDPSLRASYIQLLEAEREKEANAAAMGAEAVAMRARLLGLSDPNSATAVLARLQNERAALLGSGAAVGLAGGYNPSALESLVTLPSAGTPVLNRDMLLTRGSGGGHASLPGFSGHGMASGVTANKSMATPSNSNTTGRQPIHLYMSCDDDDLSPYQCLVRKQIELFEAQDVDAETNARGRNRPIVVGQVGIRCKWCKQLPPRKRERAAIYYPSKLDRLYQAGQVRFHALLL